MTESSNLNSALERVREAGLDSAADCDELALAICDRAEGRWWWPRLTNREHRRVSSLMLKADVLRNRYGS